jgi:hypothetical protein
VKELLLVARDVVIQIRDTGRLAETLAEFKKDGRQIIAFLSH